MSQFKWVPDFGMQFNEKVRMRAASFGDGYEQRATDGLNPITGTLSMTFTRRIDVIEEILVFLKSKSNGASFTYTPPKGTEMKMVCTDWSTTWKDHDVIQLSVNMRRVYEA